MANPNKSFSLFNSANISPDELQIVTATTTTTAGAFTGDGVASIDCTIYNSGASVVYVVFSTTASPTALNIATGANGSKMTPIPPGSIYGMRKDGAAYFAVICDTGSCVTYLLAGRGS